MDEDSESLISCLELYGCDVPSIYCTFLLHELNSNSGIAASASNISKSADVVGNFLSCEVISCIGATMYKKKLLTNIYRRGVALFTVYTELEKCRIKNRSLLSEFLAHEFSADFFRRF